MPDRVKCLHALAAHELAVPGMNPFGRDRARRGGEWWLAGPCVAVTAEAAVGGPGAVVDQAVS